MIRLPLLNLFKRYFDTRFKKYILGDMSVSLEKSGGKIKIPPDDLDSKIRSKSRRHDRESRRKPSKSSGKREKSRDASKRDSKREASKISEKGSKPKREPSAKEKNRKRIEEARIARERMLQKENLKRTESLKDQRVEQPTEKRVNSQIR